LRNLSLRPEGRKLLEKMRVALLRKTIETQDPLPERIRPY
jgi:hypothetical protein